MKHLTPSSYPFIALFILCWLGAVVSWGFGAYYMIKLMAQYRPERRWGRIVFASIFLPWFFTDEGNIFRAKLLRSIGLFLLFVGLGMAVAFCLKALTSN
jgi:hypothetical protein